MALLPIWGTQTNLASIQGTQEDLGPIHETLDGIAPIWGTLEDLASISGVLENLEPFRGIQVDLASMLGTQAMETQKLILVRTAPSWVAKRATRVACCGKLTGVTTRGAIAILGILGFEISKNRWECHIINQTHHHGNIKVMHSK